MSEDTRELFKIVNEDLRETRKLASAAQQLADAAMEEARAAKKQADACWELVIMTRNDSQRPWWRKLIGQ
jgi:hypothetical protein